MSLSRPHSRSKSASSAISFGAFGSSLKTTPQVQYSQSADDYELLNVIGIMDDISQAYCARFKPASMDVPSLVNKRDIVTVKVTDFSLSTDYELILEMINIVRNTKLCRHPSILQYYTCFVDQSEKLWTITQPVRMGSIKQLMMDYHPDGLPSEQIVATIIKEVIKGLNYLHEKHLIHNNIRADNIWLDVTGEIKITGMHQLIDKMSKGTLKPSVYKFVGDPEWQAPEVISQATTFNQKVDIYSLGITVCEMTHGKTPFSQWPALKILLCKLHYEVPTMQEQGESEKIMSKNYQRFTERCLTKNPLQRPNCSELFEDQFVKSGRDAHYLEINLVRPIKSKSSASKYTQ
ncbi:hypothetical protein MP228_002329 [Amoeboaphelidium protococcarum]|nr:hypothetical protein MP228_002329 [Amoeboaphelidium protococcarum]